MPRLARPSARSRNGLLGPNVASRSPAPEPCTSTTAGNGPAPTGTVTAPGKAQPPASTVAGSSRNVAGATYDADENGVAGAAAAPGLILNPAIRPAASNATSTSTSPRSNAQVTTTTRISPCISVRVAVCPL